MKEMDNIIKDCKQYIKKSLKSKKELNKYIKQSTILLYSYERNLVWDLMILMDNEQFEYEFVRLYGNNFIIDDHKHSPPVFTRIKNYTWLKEDFNKRLPVALWIFENATVIQECGNVFSQIISEQKKIFSDNLLSIIRRKYLEMRGERHNLRSSIKRPNNMANALIRSNIIKLCFELSLLAENKSYPFRAFLPEYARLNSSFGNDIFNISKLFLTETDQKITIELSDHLIEKVSLALSLSGNFSNDFLSRWWFYLE